MAELSTPSVPLHFSEGHDQPAHAALGPVKTHRTRWSTLVGQLFAYAGVGLLTCGTVLVMWSYFGGPTNYMALGWLTAAIGQMLLFLGVVTLISSGLDQTISEVTWRIDHLAEEVYHMGLSLDRLEREQRRLRRRELRRDRPLPENDSTREAA